MAAAVLWWWSIYHAVRQLVVSVWDVSCRVVARVSPALLLRPVHATVDIHFSWRGFRLRIIPGRAPFKLSKELFQYKTVEFDTIIKNQNAGKFF